MTVKELREVLSGFPDNGVVLLTDRVDHWNVIVPGCVEKITQEDKPNV